MQTDKFTSEAVSNDLAGRQPCLWINPWRLGSGKALPRLGIGQADIDAASARLQRFAPLLAQLFPELAASGGLIESELTEVPTLRQAIDGDGACSGRWFVKGDHALPVAGSVKARGGVHEVLEFAERIATEAGLIDASSDYALLAGPDARTLFGRYRIAVGSTGNLGLSIGVMAAALGFRAQVHMSADAREWKKRHLRERGVEVVEHAGDYGEAVDVGRREAEGDSYGYFVDDERSLSLFLGYAVAAGRLRAQLTRAGIAIGPQAPLFVYLPCGVGGAPGGIAFGLKHAFGDHAHCFFAEPVASPCVLARMLHPERPGISVYDLGLDNRTAADGLAVAKASELAVEIMQPLLSGIFTIEDDDLFRFVHLLHETEAIKVEPSAAAGFKGPDMLCATQAGRKYLLDNQLEDEMHRAIHVFWTTGGLFVPDAEYQAYQERGRKAMAT